MAKGEKSNERNVIAIKADSFTTYKDLPLVHTGCDSYASWDPRFKHLSPVLSTDSITDTIMDMLPHKRWEDEHLVITGGEPLLGWQKQYSELLDNEKMLALKELTFETNGTQPLTPEFRQYLLNWTLSNKTRSSKRGADALTFSVSPKLSVSGEKWEDAICPDIVASYEWCGYTYLKFVIGSEKDAEEAEEAVNAYRKAGFEGPVYLMPLGGTEQLYSVNNRNVAELAMRKGWRYSDRLQIPLFKNAWGT
jgi:7-carboxy-7-deazaguanine synthase